MNDPETIAALGPKAFTPDLVSDEARAEIASREAFRQYREACAKLARERHAALHKEHAAIGRDNAATEFQARNELGVLYMRIPQEEWLLMRRLYGDDCWADPEFVEAYRRDNPWAAVKTTRGTRGQEYAGRSGQRGAPIWELGAPNLRQIIAEQRAAAAEFARAVPAVSPWKRIADEDKPPAPLPPPLPWWQRFVRWIWPKLERGE